MPLRSDPSLWLNLAGVVGAYQPIGAPNSGLARFNMAHGGDNRYKTTSDSAPAWHRSVGWQGDGAAAYLDTGIIPVGDQSWSMVARFQFAEPPVFNESLVNTDNGDGIEFALKPYYREMDRYCNVTVLDSYPHTAGVMAVAGRSCFFDRIYMGVLEEDLEGVSWGAGIRIFMRPRSEDEVSTASLQALLIAARTLSAAEVFYVSRQMAYCEKNPDWSAWGRRRRYYSFSPIFMESKAVLPAVGGSYGSSSRPVAVRGGVAAPRRPVAALGGVAAPRRPKAPSGGHRSKAE